MAAGVHLAGRLGGIRHAGRLHDRQRVHVGAQPHHPARCRLAPLDDADHAGPADAGHDLVAAESLQFLRHDAGRALQVEADLRVRMQVLPPFGDFVLHGRDTIDDGHVLASRAVPASLARERIRRHPGATAVIRRNAFPLSTLRG